jgi:hypothetical protein
MINRNNRGAKLTAPKLDSIKQEIAEIRGRSAREQKAHERRDEVTAVIIQHLKTTGTFFKTPEGLFYFERGEAPRLLPLEHDSIELAALTQERYGINCAEAREFEHIMSGLETEAHLYGEEVEVHRLAHYDCETRRLYVSRFDGWVYRFDGRQIRQVPNGTDGVFFCDSASWKAYELLRKRPIQGLLDTLIACSANFGDSNGLTASDQQWLFSVWCLSQFFGSLHPTKPLLLMCGEKGGGKTLSLRKWLKLLFGRAADVTALERGKQDGFVAAVCSSPIVVFDNVDDQVSWLADHLAQLATGVSFKRRKYYTTNQQIEFQPQCFVALTSRTPKFLETRDDVLDRTLILQTERRQHFAPEQAQLDKIAQNRNLLWSELLRDLNRVVSHLKQTQGEFVEGSFRMADFAAFALNVAQVQGHETKAHIIFEKMESRRTEMLLADEPIAACLEKWLLKPENVARVVGSAELNTELRLIAIQLEVPWPYRGARALGQRLSHITSQLSQRFDVDVDRDSANQCLYRFAPKADSLNHAESQNPVIQAA